MLHHLRKEHNTAPLRKKRHSNINRRERGQSMIEFSFILVILIILLAGIVDLGRALFTYITLRDAAQEGALYASIHPTAIPEIENRVITSSNTVQNLSNSPQNSPHMHAARMAVPQPPLSVDVSYSGEACSGQAVQVDVTYHEFPIGMPFLGTVLGTQEIEINASIVSTIINPPCD